MIDAHLAEIALGTPTTELRAVAADLRRARAGLVASLAACGRKP